MFGSVVGSVVCDCVSSANRPMVRVPAVFSVIRSITNPKTAVFFRYSVPSLANLSFGAHELVVVSNKRLTYWVALEYDT